MKKFLFMTASIIVVTAVVIAFDSSTAESAN